MKILIFQLAVIIYLLYKLYVSYTGDAKDFLIISGLVVFIIVFINSLRKKLNK